MTLVVDASAAIDLLLRSEPASDFDAASTPMTPTDSSPAHFDAEVFSGLARHHRAGLIDKDEVTELLRRMADLGVTPSRPLETRVGR